MTHINNKYLDLLNAPQQEAVINIDGSYLVLAGKPLNEPVARYGPFVANTEDEVKQAMLDYQSGKMGQLS